MSGPELSALTIKTLILAISSRPAKEPLQSRPNERPRRKRSLRSLILMTLTGRKDHRSGIKSIRDRLQDQSTTGAMERHCLHIPIHNHARSLKTHHSVPTISLLTKLPTQGSQRQRHTTSQTC